MRVPAPARSAPAAGTAPRRDFEAELDSANAATAGARDAEPGPAARTEPQPPPPTRDPAPAADAAAEAPADQTQPQPASRADAAAAQTTLGAGDPTRRIAPGKGVGSSASSVHSDSVFASAARPPATIVPPTFVAGAASSPTAQAAATAIDGVRSSAQSGAPPASTALPAGPRLATGAPHARSATPELAGYRTLSPQTLQLAEAARDSVFRQIALRLGDEGSELRVLLDPPELGEVDLHLVVEKGGALRLSIGAERPELLLTLDKYLHELRQSLAAAGLDVAHAEVHARERGQQRQHDSADRSAWRPFAATAQPTSAAAARAEWWTTEGLQLWA